MSVVIVNFMSAHLIERCLRGVAEDWCAGVVIVDNSADERQRRALAAMSPAVPLTIITSAANIGFGGAANIGIDRSLRDHPDDPVWLVNPDIEFEAEAARILLARIRLGLDDIVSPAIVTGPRDDLTVWFAGGVADSRTGDVRHDRYLEPYHRSSWPELSSTSFICGAAPVFTPRAWTELGGFRDDLFLYWEDVELSFRAQELGLALTIVHDALLWHAVGGSSDQNGQSDVFYFYSARNRLMIMRERRGFRALAPVALAQMCAFFLRPIRNEREGKATKAMAVLRGYWSARKASGARASAERT